MAKQLKSRRLITKTKRNQNPTDITKKRSERKTSDSSNMTGGSDEARRTRRRSTETSDLDRDFESRALKPFFNRDIFKDPFFTEPWQDLFNFKSFDDLVGRAKEMTKSAMKGARESQKNVDTSHPGSYSSKSFYRNISGGTGRPEKREVISQETVTNVDDKGRKYTELWKNYEKGDHKKTTHSKMIGDRGMREMRSRDMKTGEEYEHIDYKHMNEKDLHNFQSEFERGVRNVKNLMPSASSLTSLLPDMTRLDRDLFPSPRMLGW
jgi:hypothetical protein